MTRRAIERSSAFFKLFQSALASAKVNAMSLDAFQCAAVDLTLDYRKARAVRDGDPAVLAGYELTDRERSRLVAIVGQPMMSVHCSLSRGNRVEIIGGAFPMLSGSARRPVTRSASSNGGRGMPLNCTGTETQALMDAAAKQSGK